MQRSTSSYSYPPYAASSSPPKQYPAAHSTSSAFSASANPNEDWTKISDLAERRRIQNRIAQRNYRKKLKKRLEDLERRAGSDSGSPEHKDDEIESPEQQYSVIAQPVRSPSSSAAAMSAHSRRRSTAPKSERSRTPDVLGQQYVLPVADRGMFSEQYTRQMSTSPPPLSYNTFQSSNPSYAVYPQSNPYCGQPNSNMDVSSYPQYLSTPSYLPGTVIKQEYYGDDDLSPFAMSYASMAGVDVSHANSYQDLSSAYTPSLTESFELSQADTPPESTPQTPPLLGYDLYV